MATLPLIMNETKQMLKRKWRDHVTRVVVDC
jgi:hypothetical protein